MRRPFLVRLRPTLRTTIIGLVLLTALAIGGSAAILTLSVTRTLIDQARTDAVTAADFAWRRLDRVAVKGHRQGTLICELMGLKDAIAADLLAARDTYERALDAYLAAEFDRAAELFAEDLGAAMMRDRTFALANDPPMQWDGVHVMEEK